MYGQFFNIDESAFSIAPNPHYLYLSNQHQEALAHLLYGITRPGGFVLITGEIGTGKTTICRSIFTELPEDADVALIVNPKLSVEDLLASVCDELNISYPTTNVSTKTYINCLSNYLIESHANNKNVILIIDEAQNLSLDALETIRTLTNIETDEKKLLQIILIGQPELRERLNAPEMEQLNQRITARFHLQAFNKNEVEDYIQHRIKTGGGCVDLFSSANINDIHKLTGGIPRLINALCDRILLGAYVQRKKIITSEIIYQAASEALGKNLSKRTFQPSLVLTSVIAIGLCLFSIFLLIDFDKKTSEFDIKNVSENQTNEESTTLSEINLASLPNIKDSQDADLKNDNNAGHQDDKMYEIVDNIEKSTVEELIENKSTTTNATIESFEINSNVVLTSEQKIFERLFLLWGVEYNVDSNACEQARTNDLFCWNSAADIDLIKRLNRPVVLINKDINGDQSLLLVSKLDRQNAVVFDGESEYIVPIELLSESWQGDFTLLWQPLTDVEFIKPGMQGDFVTDVDRYIAIIFNRSPNESHDNIYNLVLVNEIRDFQRIQKILPDGIIGPITQVYMNNIVQLDVPKLR